MQKSKRPFQINICLLHAFKEVKTDSSLFYKPLTLFMEDKTTLPKLYKRPTRIEVKPASPWLYKPPTHFAEVKTASDLLQA